MKHRQVTMGPPGPLGRDDRPAAPPESGLVCQQMGNTRSSLSASREKTKRKGGWNVRSLALAIAFPGAGEYGTIAAMASLYTPQNFPFGLEIEMYLRPKKTATARMLKRAVGWDQENTSGRYHRTKLRQVVKLALDFSQVPCTAKKGASVWDKWLIDDDACLDEGEGDGYCKFVPFVPFQFEHKTEN